jgi:hypothetical protein
MYQFTIRDSIGDGDHAVHMTPRAEPSSYLEMLCSLCDWPKPCTNASTYDATLLQ